MSAIATASGREGSGARAARPGTAAVVRRAGAANRAVAGFGVALGLAALLAACGGGPRGEVERLVAAYDSLAARAGWPGFDPSRIPLAVYDGERTWLLRHPDPPPGFEREEARSPLWFAEARHAAATANTTADLGGFPTAILLADPEARRSAGRPTLAARLVHEAFHVHQRRRHPEWAPNEVELFTYPVEDVEGLRLRRLETAALRRALRPEAPDSVRRLCWSRGWSAIRRQRTARLGDGAAAYEAGAELWEGLARYVESRALGQGEPPEPPAEGYPPEAVGSRAYEVGHALGWLLDRMDPGWKARLERGETGSLEEALREALVGTTGKTCRPTPDEYRRARTVAAADLRRLTERRRELRRRFEEAPGWRVEVVAPAGAPLFPAAFDPQNVDRLGEGVVLHARFLRLVAGGAELEVLGRASLTEPAGLHPLFTGVRRLLVTGLEDAPEAEETGSAVRIEAEGFRATLPGARLERDGRSWRVELPDAASEEPDGQEE